MREQVRIETARLILRDLSVDDVTDRYCGWLNDEEVTRFLEARFDDNSPESLKEYVRLQVADERTVFCAIVEKPDRMVGTMKIGPINTHHQRADMGILIGDRTAWGRGYAVEAIQAFSGFAFDQLGLSRLSAAAYAVNVGSIKAFTRAGFQVEGVLKSGVRSGEERVDLVQMGHVAPQTAMQDRTLSRATPSSPGNGVPAGSGHTEQRDLFLVGEGDAWFRRNPEGESQADWRDELVASHVTPSSSVLEIGCSDGRRLAAVARLAPAQRFVGIDPSAAAIAAGMLRYSDLDLGVGTADELPFGVEFDVVVVGFCLYLCDRALIPRIVSETDRVLKDGGTLIIVDFDPRIPTRRSYRHCPGLWSYKLDYAAPFLAFPSYSLVQKELYAADDGVGIMGDSSRIAMNVLRKRLPGAYAEEPDER